MTKMLKWIKVNTADQKVLKRREYGALLNAFGKSNKIPYKFPKKMKTDDSNKVSKSVEKQK